MSTVKKV